MSLKQKLDPMVNVLIILCFLKVPVNGVFECVPGTWGSDCASTCGNCEGGGVFCQVHDGKCMNGCASGYTGPFCKDECPKGTFGQYCTTKCGRCAGRRPICNRETGFCEAGCTWGFQPPFCLKACEFNTWGDQCREVCECPDDCGCDPVNGECHKCGSDGRPVYKELRALSAKDDCINPFIISQDFDEYVPLNAMDVPIKPVLYGLGFVMFFAFTNFMWWLVCVRKPKPKTTVIAVDRSKKPKFMVRPIVHGTIRTRVDNDEELWNLGWGMAIEDVYKPENEELSLWSSEDSLDPKERRRKSLTVSKSVKQFGIARKISPTRTNSTSTDVDSGEVEAIVSRDEDKNVEKGKKKSKDDDKNVEKGKKKRE